MEIKAVLNAQKITELAKERFKEERSLNHLEGWFLAKEIQRECDEKFKDDPDCIRIAKTQVEVMKRIPLLIFPAGTLIPTGRMKCFRMVSLPIIISV